MSGFTAPENSGSSRLNTEILPAGFQLCILYAIIDIGTQDTKFGNKRQVRLSFEFPRHTRVFYEGEEAKPCVIFVKETFSMAEKSNLRKKYIQGMLNRQLTENEAKNFDFTSLIGKPFVANVTHSADGKYANISTINPLDAQMMQLFNITDVNTLQPINETVAYHISQGFENDVFKMLPKFMREQIKESEEGQRHKQMGGTFLEPTKEDFDNASSSNSASGNAPAGLTMIATDYTYDQYKQSGWTDEALVKGGKAKWNQPQAAPAPAGGAPAPAPMSTPAPAPVQEAPPVQQAPTAAPVQAAPQETPVPPAAPATGNVIMRPNSQFTYEQLIGNNWTEQQIVDQGFADFK